MTLTTLVSQLKDLAGTANGRIRVNCSAFTKTQLTSAIRSWLNPASVNTIPDHYIGLITLDDGIWALDLSYSAEHGYDYYIPETREDEAALKAKFEAALQATRA